MADAAPLGVPRLRAVSARWKSGNSGGSRGIPRRRISPSTKRFFKLLPEERLRIQAFLRSLAPPPVAVARFWHADRIQSWIAFLDDAGSCSGSDTAV